LKIIVLTGGTSPEREISLRSGKAITDGLRAKGHEVFAIDPAFGTNQPKSEQQLFTFDPLEKRISNDSYIKCINSNLFDDCDIIFIALHGKWGEDGTVQSLLDLKGLKYTGSGVLSSAIAIDKSLTKILFQHYHINTPKWLTVNGNGYEITSLQERVIKLIGLPCIVKPNDQGSTVGFSLVKRIDELESAIKLALKFSPRTLIEEYIQGRELTASILGKEVLPIVEVKPKHELYDYECKYTKGMTEYFCPASLDENLVKQIEHQSLLAFEACECKAFARVDFMLNDKNELFCLEINTIPGMTDLSLVPMAAKSVGIDFPELVQKIVELSL
jgi:D-alanine-D-alanine ligase